MPKSALDKDLKKVGRLEEATQALSRSIAAPGLAILFLIAIFLFMSGLAPVGPLSLFVIAGGVIAGYMALNIGANDVANNMGPAVGSRALPLGAALVIAAICEAAGAILAGGDVVNTISKDIVRPAGEIDVRDFVMLMMASFLAAAIWIHLATFLNAPVSTIAFIVGGVHRCRQSLPGFGAVNWPTMGAIAASWVISPVLGGLIAAALLGFVKWQVLFREDRVAAARRWVPVMIGLMAGVFAMYLALKGFSKIWKPSTGTVWLLGVAAFALGTLATRPWVVRRAATLENRRTSCLHLQLMLRAASSRMALNDGEAERAAAGAAAAGRRRARLDADHHQLGEANALSRSPSSLYHTLCLRCFEVFARSAPRSRRWTRRAPSCVALAAAITVLIASALGLPVSSTHIAIGGVFGVGFLREQLANLGLRADGPKPVKPSPNEPSSLSATPEDAIRTPNAGLAAPRPAAATSSPLRRPGSSPCPPRAASRRSSTGC